MTTPILSKDEWLAKIDNPDAAQLAKRRADSFDGFAEKFENREYSTKEARQLSSEIASQWRATARALREAIAEYEMIHGLDKE